MDRNPRISSSSRRRNVVKPARIDTILGHDREGALRLNFGLAVHKRSSYNVARGGVGGRGGARHGDSSEPLTLSGSLSQSQGAGGSQSHGLFPSQGVSLSQGTPSQPGHQSQGETGGFSVSQPSPDLLASYTNTHHSRDVGGAGRGRSALRSVSGVVGARAVGREPQRAGPIRGGSRSSSNGHRGVPDRRLAHASRPSSSAMSSKSLKARRPMPPSSDVDKGGSRTRHTPDGRTAKGFDAGGRVDKSGFNSEGAAVQAFERLLSEQFRSQMLSGISDLRVLVETTREALVDQQKGAEKDSTATRELRRELRETRSVAQQAQDSSSKALRLLETTIPAAFHSLETGLRKAEEVIAGVAETVAATAACAREAAAAAASISERRTGGGSDGELQSQSQPQQQQQEQQNADQVEPSAVSDSQWPEAEESLRWPGATPRPLELAVGAGEEDSYNPFQEEGLVTTAADITSARSTSDAANGTSARRRDAFLTTSSEERNAPRLPVAQRHSASGDPPSPYCDVVQRSSSGDTVKRSASTEGEDDDEDSFGVQAVEAYMATKRQPKRPRSDKPASTATARNNPKRVVARSNETPPSSRKDRRSSSRDALQTTLSEERGRERRRLPDELPTRVSRGKGGPSWLVGGGSGW